MRKLSFILVVIAMAVCGSRARASLVLVNLNAPTLQTLIGLGSDGITVDGLHFYDFAFNPSPFGGPATASDVLVQPVTGAADGLKFLANWSASSGDGFIDTITYHVASADGAASINTISLLSNGTAAGVAPGAFVATSLSAHDTGGAIVGRGLGTINDGVSSPVDLTNPDNNTDSVHFAPIGSLTISDSVLLASGIPGRGGSVSATTVENTFNPVPASVPSPDGTLVIPFVAAFAAMRRRRPPRSVI